MALAIIPEGLAGFRADIGAARLFGVSRSRIEQAAEQGKLLVDQVPVVKSHRLNAGAMIEVHLDEPRPLQMTAMIVQGMRIVDDDADLVVVDKPPGVASHPSQGWDGPSVVEHLLAAGFPPCPSGPPERPGIVSRLDVGTSGLMVVAKSAVAYEKLKQAFSSRQVHKIYHGLCQGYLQPPVGTIDAPIAHTRTDEWKMEVSPRGKQALTHFRVLETRDRVSLVELRLETGRTHQIRVHMASIRHPLVGDLLYGADPRLAEELGVQRQWLHAKELGFIHPRSGKMMTYTCDYPEDLLESLV
ncbi:MAG: RluA family pseudouridine synthase [Propionibacteriaceae bacterium]|nr:RluA family pseudouridine synthase [Propionibacteriaceae bacterium]